MTLVEVIVKKSVARYFEKQKKKICYNEKEV